MEYVHVSSKVEERIEALKKTGKHGAGLAEKAVRIVEGLKSGELGQKSDESRLLTKYGEKRIKSCCKYDLGSGYRLITIQRGPDLYVPFLGPHDECQRWLERNSGLNKRVIEGEASVFSIEQKDDEFMAWDLEEDFSEDVNDEDLLFHRPSDEDLRTVFSGLVEGAKDK